MTDTKPNPPDENRKFPWMQYASLASQFLVSIGIGVFLGLKADQWLKFKFPVLVWLLPLLIMASIIFRLIKDTSKKR